MQIPSESPPIFDRARVLIYLAFAFGIAWTAGLIIFFTGGIRNSPIIGGGMTLALVLMVILYMGAPAMANIFTRLVTREGWDNLFLRPHFHREWSTWIIAWFAPVVMILFGAAFYFVIFPAEFDPTLGTMQKLMASGGAAANQSIQSLWTIILLQTLGGTLISPLVNGVPVLGEEFGWRAYLQPKLLALGERRGLLIMGVIWGLWHAPVIAMGHNYGLEYPGAPWTGILAMVWFCIITSIFIGWCTTRAGSVWPAVIAHSVINGVSGIGIVFLKINAQPNLLLGPFITGVLGSAGFTLTALVIYIFLSPKKEAAVSLVNQNPSP